MIIHFKSIEKYVLNNFTQYGFSKSRRKSLQAAQAPAHRAGPAPALPTAKQAWSNALYLPSLIFSLSTAVLPAQSRG